MLVYVLNYLSLPVYMLLFRKKRTASILVAIQMLLILCLKYKYLGVDYTVYERGFNFISSLSFSQLLSTFNVFGISDLSTVVSFESGYTFLNWVISHLGFSYEEFLLIYNLFFVICIYFFISRLSNEPMIAFALVLSTSVFEYSFGIIRQTLAMSLLMLAVLNYFKGKNRATIVLLAIAFLFHRTALIFVLLFLLNKIEINKKRFKYIFAGETLAVFIAPYMLHGIVAKILSLMGKSGYISTASSYSIGGQLILFIIIGILILRFFDFDDITKEKSICLWGYIVLMIVQILGSFGGIIARAVWLPFILLIVMIPNMFCEPNKVKYLDLWFGNYHAIRYNQLVKFGINVFGLLFMIYNLSGSPINPYIPFWK